jgi:hypothetical protein
MSQTAKIEDLPPEVQAGLSFMLGYIDYGQWDDALVAQNDARIREAILELKNRWVR